MKKALLLFGLFISLAISVSAQKVKEEKAISVAAGSYYPFTYTFTETGRAWGKFEATGGKNDIECYILDENGFKNFKNNNQFRYLYFSGRVTVETFDLTLTKGTYYLVFSNKWSVMTPKAVTISFYEEDRK